MSDQPDPLPDENRAPPALSPASARREEEGRFDIVRRQFRKNRAAVWGLRVALALAHVAIFAPVIASGDPYLYRAPGEALQFPWLAHLVDVISWEHSLDRAFNVLMVVMTLYWVTFAVFHLTHFVIGLVKQASNVDGSPELRRIWSIVQRSFLGVGAFVFLLHATGFGLKTSHQKVDYRAPINAVRAANIALKNAEKEGRSADVPTLQAALVKAEAEREEYLILTTPVPYGYREMLPLVEDKFLPAWTISKHEVHLFGTGETGRDIFARILYGTRISLTIGLVAVGIYVTIGTILGSLAGYFGGRVDMVIMRVVEIVICIPGLFLMLTIVSLFETRSIMLIMFAIGVVAWTGITRLVRGEVLREKNTEYVDAARAMGLSTPRIIFRHVLPNSIGPVLVAATFGIPGAILAESGLSFLGLGDVSVPSWGRILYDARTHEYWHLIIPPSIAIFITVTALNLVGDGLRDALDPKLRN